MNQPKLSDIVVPEGGFRAILADPPWRFATWNKATAVKRRASGTNVSAAVHYDTMPTDDISSLPVAELAADDCCLFMWISWPMLPDAMRLIEAWGFTYKTCAFDWMKARTQQLDIFRDDADALMGMGYWTRANSEPCLLATRCWLLSGICEPRRAQRSGAMGNALSVRRARFAGQGLASSLRLRSLGEHNSRDRGTGGQRLL